MQRQTVNQNNVQWFFENSADYRELEEDMLRVYERTENPLIKTFLEKIKKVSCFKELDLEISQTATPLLTAYAKENNIKQENALKNLDHTATYDQKAKLLLCIMTLGETVYPYFETEIEEEKKAVQNFITTNPTISYLDYLSKLKNPNAQDTTKMAAIVQQIKEANTFDGLLKITETVSNNSYTASRYSWINTSISSVNGGLSWINAGIYGGMAAFNYHLSLLRQTVITEQHQFNYGAPTEIMTVARPTPSSQ